MPINDHGRGELRKRWACNQVVLVATRCGRLDAAGELGSLGMSFLRSARHEAADIGCVAHDIDDATIQGLDWGRAEKGGAQ